MNTGVESELFPASFRGVPFLFTDTSRSGGRKTAVHEYPNKDGRFIEDLGRSVPIYNITAIISTNPTNKTLPGPFTALNPDKSLSTAYVTSQIKTEKYTEKRNEFIKALEAKGSATLVHPFYGSVRVSVLKYSLSETTKSLGVATFNIEFAETELAPPLPVADKSKISSDTANLKTISYEVLRFRYTPYLHNRKQILHSATILQQMGDAATKAVSFIQQQKATVNNALFKINNTISYIKTAKNLIVNTALSLVTTVTSLFDGIRGLGTTPQHTYGGFTTLFKFNATVQAPLPITIFKKQDLEVHNLTKGIFNVLALTYAYEQAVLLDYVTVADVESVRTQLEDQYMFILDIPDVDPDILTELRTIRASVTQFLKGVAQNAYQTSSIQTSTMPLIVLAYQYYGNTDYTTQLAAMNNVVEPSFVEGNVEIIVQ